MARAPGRAMLAAIAASASMLAQTTQLAGLVLDSSGGAVGGAAVTLVNQENGIRRSVRSSDEGVYAIPSVRPGPYKLTVRKEGFRSVTRTGLQLELGRSARVDFSLQVGSVEEVITVESSPWLTQSETAMLGALVPREFVEGLPVNGRSLLGLLELTPGVVLTPVRDGAETGQFSVNGQRPNANLISIDGMSANFGMQEEAPGQVLAGSVPALSAIGSLHSLLSLSGVEEFRLQTSNGAAESGRFSGGQIALSTRGGGAEWHLSAQHFFRNEKLDANDWFSNLAGRPRAPLRWNHFGAAAGGPVVRGRTFLFASYEGFRLRQARDLLAIVPSEEQRRAAQGAVRAVLPYFPHSNSELPLPGFGAYEGRASSRAGHHAGGLRVDHAASSRLSLFARLYAAPSNSVNGTQRSPELTGLSIADTDFAPVQITAGAGVTLGPESYLDVRFNYSRMAVHQSARQFALTGVEQWDPYVVLPRDVGGQPVQWRRVWLGDWTPLEHAGNRRLAQAQWQLLPSWSLVRGGHQLRLGADYRMLRPTLREPLLAGFAAFPDAGRLEAFGLPPRITLERRAPIELQFHNVSLWASDTWKLHPRITVNYGLRWEWNPPPVTRDAQPAYVVAGLTDHEAPRIEATRGGRLWRNRMRDFAPRFSVAWRATRRGTIVVRAGTGLHYNLGNGAVLRTLPSQPGYFNVVTSFGGTLGALGPLELPAFDPSKPEFPGLSGALPELRTPLAMQNSVTVDLASARAGALSAGWVSSLGRRLLRAEFAPLAGDLYQYLELTTNHGSSNYHALQMQFRSPERRGLRGMISYAWSHAIDNGSRDTEVRLASARRLDRGNSDFDVRHSATAAFLFALPATAPFLSWARGWSIDGIIRARTGFPFSPFVSGWPPDPARPVSAYEPAVFRPDLDLTQPAWLIDSKFPGGRALNPSAFPVPAEPRAGTLGRNALGGLVFRQADLSIHRRFAIMRRAGRAGGGFEVRADVFNLFNTPNFAMPQVALTTSANPPYVPPFRTLSQELSRAGIGGSPAGGLAPVFQVGGPRSVQLSLRIDF